MKTGFISESLPTSPPAVVPAQPSRAKSTRAEGSDPEAQVQEGSSNDALDLVHEAMTVVSRFAIGQTWQNLTLMVDLAGVAAWKPALLAPSRYAAETLARIRASGRAFDDVLESRKAVSMATRDS